MPTLEGLDATRFNFFSDLFATGTRILPGLAIAYFYNALMTVHLRGTTADNKNHKIHVEAFGSVPADFFGGATYAWMDQGSLDSTGDSLCGGLYNTPSFADLGLSF